MVDKSVFVETGDSSLPVLATRKEKELVTIIITTDQWTQHVTDLADLDQRSPCQAVAARINASFRFNLQPAPST